MSGVILRGGEGRANSLGQRNQGFQKPRKCMQIQAKAPEQLQRGNEDGKADPRGNKRGLDL